MRSIQFGRFRWILGAFSAAIVVATTISSNAQQQLSDPVFRVPNDAAAQPTAVAPETRPAGTSAITQAAPATAAATPTAPVAGAKRGFDLTKKPDEHPLAPVLRIVKESQDHINRNVR